MAAIYQNSSSMVTVTSDLRKVANLYGDDRARYIAVWVCAFLKARPEYATIEDRQNVEIILGEESSRLVDRFLQMYPINSLTTSGIVPHHPARIQDLYNIVYSYQLSLDKCERLMQLILNHPFLVFANNEMSKSADGTIALAYKTEVSLMDKKTAILVGEKLAAIKHRTEQSIIPLVAISQLGLEALQETIGRLRSSMMTYGTYQPNVYLVRYQPMQNRQSCCCCTIL